MKLLLDLAKSINGNNVILITKHIAALNGNERFSSDVLYEDHFLHWMYKNDSALHLVAASHQHAFVQKIIDLGIDINDNKNRRSATPLHYASDAPIDHPHYDHDWQRKTILCLIKNKADINSIDKSGATPLLRAIRCRSLIAVQTLIKAGADINICNARGTNAMKLATINSGRGGSGSEKCKYNQMKIIAIIKSRT
jgi:ankyrin repeat protein